MEMNHYIIKYYKPQLSIDEVKEDYYQLFQEYFESKGMNGLAMGKTGLLFDLYLWQDQEEVAYDINLPEGEKITVPVVFMSDFVSNGWSHYTTLGHSYSGGWVGSRKLYCVEEAYGPKDEEGFLVSYVSHEAQHFVDMKIFPKLKQSDLEYRAKLTELVLAKETSSKIIRKFIRNAKYDTQYAHGFANHTVIKRLSESVFGSEFESNLNKWEEVSVDEINRASMSLLKEHTQKLKSIGASEVESYITTL